MGAEPDSHSWVCVPMGVHTRCALMFGSWVAGIFGPWISVPRTQEWVEPHFGSFDPKRAPRREGTPLATWTPQDGSGLVVEPTVDHVAALSLYAGEMMTLPAYADDESGERREGLMICLESKSDPFVGPAGIHTLGVESGTHHWGYNEGLGIEVGVTTEAVGCIGEEKVLLFAFDEHGVRRESNRRLHVLEARTGRVLTTIEENPARPWHRWPQFAAVPDVNGDDEADFSVLVSAGSLRNTGRSLQRGCQVDIYCGRTFVRDRTVDLGLDPNVDLQGIYWDAWADAKQVETPRLLVVALEMTDGDSRSARPKTYIKSIRSAIDGETLEVRATPLGVSLRGMNETLVEDLDGDGLRDLACTSHQFDSVQYRSLATFGLLDTWTPPEDQERPRISGIQVLRPNDDCGREFVLVESRSRGGTFQAEVWQPRGRGMLGTWKIRGGFSQIGMSLLPDADGDFHPELAAKWQGDIFFGHLLFPSRRWIPGG